MSKRLPIKEKLILINRFKKGESVAKICRESGISRIIFYRWLKQYQESSSRIKSLVLTPKVAKGKQHWRISTPGKEREVIKLALKHPNFSSEKIGRLVNLSGYGVWNILKRNRLNTQQARENYIRQYGPSLIKSLTAADWRTLIRRYLSGEKIAYLCREFNISRTIFYRKLKRYQMASEEEKIVSLSSCRPKGEKHWRFVPGAEDLILEVVVKKPYFSSHKICQNLKLKFGKQVIGSHGVYNLLKKLNLNTLEKRLAYVQSKTPVLSPVPALGWQEIIRRIIGNIPVISAIPPPRPFHASFPLRTKNLLKPLFTSFVSGLVIFNLLFFWIRLLIQAGNFANQIGLVFATLALLIGGFFFTYSMKYYFTLALVLSFSRRTEDPSTHSARSGPWGNGYSLSIKGLFSKNGVDLNGNGSLKSWLARVFGLTNGGYLSAPGSKIRQPADQPDSRTVWQPKKGGGLQPSLDHITLGRKPFFSIHLPFYNEKKVAERIMKACASMDYYEKGRARFEVIVCDDSTDETVEIVERFSTDWNKSHDYGPKIKVLHRPTREGFKGGALSYALKALDPATEFVCVFDADFVPYPDSLTQFLKYFKATGGWNEEKDYRADNIKTIPYATLNPALSNNITPVDQQSFDSQLSAISQKSSIAVVAGYQWHVLNKSENWITRGVRTEYAGSYVIERPGQEILGSMKIIHGSVYAIRADVIKHFGWGTSITEDYELTLRIYEKGFKVAFTPYIQAPSECVSTIKRLIRQRMRWAEGHSFNTRKQFIKLMFGSWEKAGIKNQESRREYS